MIFLLRSSIVAVALLVCGYGDFAAQFYLQTGSGAFHYLRPGHPNIFPYYR